MARRVVKAGRVVSGRRRAGRGVREQRRDLFEEVVEVASVDEPGSPLQRCRGLQTSSRTLLQR